MPVTSGPAAVGPVTDGTAAAGLGGRGLPVRPPVETVNFHLWQPCNMHCRFCFAAFRDVRRDVLPAGHLPEEDAVRVVELLAAAGFEKITFAGGEPLLCPWLPRLVATARRAGLVTGVVTNGTLLTREFLAETATDLDWVTLSVDSVVPATSAAIGRSRAGRPMDAAGYRELCRLVADAGPRLKINTVVNRLNWTEDLTDFIVGVRPRRWKLLQALPVRGQNDTHIDTLTVSADQFEAYVRRHAGVRDAGITLVVEETDAILGSYAMVDPAGRFIDNLDHRYVYSAPILSHGVTAALAQVRIDRSRFLRRGGRYDWLT